MSFGSGPTPPAERAALRRLYQRHPELAAIERTAGPLPWRERQPGFGALLRAVVAQQISTHAAGAIWNRTIALLPDPEPKAHAFLRLSDAALRGAGFSGRKVEYARGLAQAIVARRLDLDALAAMADEDAIGAISALRGFGRWSGEIYLLFALRRRDVFPADDLALAASYQLFRGLKERPAPKALRRAVEPWAPYRGLAARLLWHHYHHVTRKDGIGR